MLPASFPSWKEEALHDFRTIFVLFACKALGFLVVSLFRRGFCWFPSLHFSVSPLTRSTTSVPSTLTSSVFHSLSGFSFLKIKAHQYFVFLKALVDLGKKRVVAKLDCRPSPQLSPSLPYSSTQEPSQQSASPGASPLSKSESLETPGSSRPGVAGLKTAAAFKPVGSTGVVKSPSWQRPNQAGIFF